MVHPHLGPPKGGVVEHQQQQVGGKVAQREAEGGVRQRRGAQHKGAVADLHPGSWGGGPTWLRTQDGWRLPGSAGIAAGAAAAGLCRLGRRRQPARAGAQRGVCAAAGGTLLEASGEPLRRQAAARSAGPNNAYPLFCNTTHEALT